MLLPTFVIIGERRAGTTGLAATLEQHPQVFVHPNRDRGYFLDDVARRGWNYVHKQFGSERWDETHSQEDYSRFFEVAGPISKPAIGEKSADYFFSPAAPARLAHFLPEAKFILTLRHPVERAWSHYWNEVAKGRERLTFEDAIKAEAERSRIDPWAHNHLSYSARGFYDKSLTAFYEHIEPGRLLVSTLEARSADPHNEMRRILEFIGVDASAPLVDRPAKRNANRALTPRSWVPAGVLRSAVQGYGALVDRAAGRLFANHKSFRRAITQIAKAPLYEPASRRRMAPETRRHLEQLYQPHIAALESMLGRSLTEWKSQSGDSA